MINIYKIFKRQLALQLINLNNKLIYTEPNHKRHNFVVFCFEDTIKLREDISKINNK